MDEVLCEAASEFLASWELLYVGAAAAYELLADAADPELL